MNQVKTKLATSTMLTSRAMIFQWISMSLEQKSAGRSVRKREVAKPGPMSQITTYIFYYSIL